MPITRPQKGRSLERAVQFVQQTILQSDPHLQGVKFSIEANKIVVVSGVRHEIDVLVKTLPNSPYESTPIFECKNWEKPVGKNEVIILTEKVNVVRANRGFLVAKSISKDAMAQLELDRRLRFIRCSEDFLNISSLTMELIHSVHDMYQKTVLIKFRGATPAVHPQQIELTEVTCRLDNKPVTFSEYIEKHVAELVSHDHAENSAKYRNEGTHPGEETKQIDFHPGEFVLNGLDVENMKLLIRFMVTVRKQKLVSKFELEGQGRVFSFEEIDDRVIGTIPQINIVQRL